VKSAQQMVITAQDLKNAGIDVPILVGGAALTRKFTKDRIGPEYDGMVLYAKDAMYGLELANQLSDPEQRKLLIEELRVMKESYVMDAGNEDKKLPTLSRVIRSNTDQTSPVYIPPDLDRHVMKDYPISHIIPYINMQMLMGHHLGIKGNVEELIAEKNEKAVQLKGIVDTILQEAQQDGIITANGMYQFFPAQSSGDSILVYDSEDHTKVIQTFHFPRQQVEPYLCLADFLKSVESGVMDYVGFLIVTAGKGIRELAGKYKDEGSYLRSHALQSIALETAEGLAERIHHIMRDVWGFSDPIDMTMKQRHGARYQGIKDLYSSY
jgi:5-methyltetrahydrofolate--homocysteine methyltransferase